MNNVRRVYRVEHGSIGYGGTHANIGIGPYMFFQLSLGEAIKVLPSDVTVEDIKNCSNLLYQYDPYPYHLRPRGQFKPGKTLPASDRWIRPGPREDPLLREYLKKNYLVNPEDATSGTNQNISNDPFIFAFDSMEQLNRWFFCDKERALLAKLGFVVKTRKFKSEGVILGRSQVLCKINPIYSRDNAFASMTFPLTTQNENIHTTTRNTA